MAILTEKTREAIEAAAASYPQRRTAALTALRLAQEQVGYLPPEAIDEVAALLDLDPNALAMLATFYSLLYTEPVGRYVIGVCNNLSCYLRGSDQILDQLKARLGIDIGGTTADGLFTLHYAECLASCHTAPAMTVNEEYHENLTPERVDELLAQLRQAARARNGADIPGCRPEGRA